MASVSLTGERKRNTKEEEETPRRREEKLGWRIGLCEDIFYLRRSGGKDALSLAYLN